MVHTALTICACPGSQAIRVCRFRKSSVLWSRSRCVYNPRVHVSLSHEAAYATPASLATGGRSKGWLTNLTSDSGCRQHCSPNVISASSKLKLTIHTIPTSKLSSQGLTGQSAKSQNTTWRYRPSAVINMSAATPSWLSARNHWMRFPEDRRLHQASEGLSTHFCSLACSCETHLMHSSLSSNLRRTQHILPRNCMFTGTFSMAWGFLFAGAQVVRNSRDPEIMAYSPLHCAAHERRRTLFVTRRYHDPDVLTAILRKCCTM